MYIALSCIPSPYPLTLPPKKNKCMKKTKLFILFICACMALPAQEKGKRPLWKVELAGALNNYDAWEVEPSVVFLPLDYVGASLGLMFIRPYHDNTPAGTSQDKQLRWSYTDDYAPSYLLALRPALQLNTPKWWVGRDKDYALYLSLSPGLTLPLPANRGFNIDYYPNKPGMWTTIRREYIQNQGARTVYYHLRTALSLEIDGGFIFSLGYTCSDFDLYGGSRNITIEGQKLSLPAHKLMHSVSISLGYRF